MNLKDLSKEAIAAGKKHNGVLSAEIQRQIALGYVATWLYGQDDTICDSRVRQTANGAISDINGFFARFDAAA